MAVMGESSHRLFGGVTAGRLAALAREVGTEESDPESVRRLHSILVSENLLLMSRLQPPAGDMQLGVLVVDDEDGIRVTLGHMLRHHGCRVGEARNAREALASVAGGWDIVILDIMLPDANGLEIIPALQAARPGIEIVVATAFGTVESSVSALRCGAADYLMKPFSIAEVTRLIARSVERKRLLVERESLLHRLEHSVFESQLLSEVTRATWTTLDPRDLVAIFIESLPEVLRPDLARAWASGPDGEVSWEVGKTGSGGPLVPFARALEEEILARLGRPARHPAGDARELAAANAPRATDRELHDDVAWIAVPFFVGSYLGGLVILVSAETDRYRFEDAALIYRVAETLSINAERGRELVETQTRRMESVMGAMGEGVVVTDARGIPIVVNPAARSLLSLPKEGDPAHLMNRSPVGHGVLAHLKAVLARGEASTTREFLLEGDPPRKLALQAGLVTGDGSEARGVVALLEDITRRREFDILQSEFVSAVSHELRTPLSCVRNYVDMVLERRAGDLTPNQERFLATARRNVDRLTHMIDNLLSLSRSEEVRADASHETVDFSTLSRTLVEAVRTDAGERGVRIDLKLPVERLEVRGDRERLAQAFGLLVRQAVKVSGRESVIEIHGGRANRASLRPPLEDVESLANHPRWIRISVRLHHAEVTPAEARDLFRRFRPSRNTDSRPLSASGLDLALARNLVEAHEGHLWAEVRDRSGLDFELILPVEGPSPRQGELLERVRTLLERSRREGLPMSVLLFRLGRHLPASGAVGASEEDDHDELADMDAALRAVVGVLRCSLRQEDRLFANRAHGELVLMLERTDSRGMTIVCDRVASRLRVLGESEPGPLAGFIAELGWSTFPQDGVTAQEIMALARRRCVPVDARRPSPSEGGMVSCLTQES